MQRYKILHRTYYNFSAAVWLQPHTLRLRPREGHELRIESSTLEITPPATLRWHHDVEDNSVATATFDVPANQLLIESDVIIQQYNQAPLDFLVADYAVDYPFAYIPEDKVVLSAYMNLAGYTIQDPLTEWVAKLWQSGERIQTFALLQRLCVHIHQTLAYQLREEPGVQTAAADIVLRYRLMPGLRVSIHGSRTALGVGRAFCKWLPPRTTIDDQLWGDPCLGRSVPARRGLEGVRSHHRRNRRNQSLCCGGGKIARISAADSWLVRWASGSQHECGGLGDRVVTKDRSWANGAAPPRGRWLPAQVHQL